MCNAAIGKRNVLNDEGPIVSMGDLDEKTSEQISDPCSAVVAMDFVVGI
jgi:hypothetical protein